ncbi:MAG: hypothetical protein RBU30_16840 [Polyangia bacterium]|nr:hypothetical protein [Polyangia bacterium]
MAPPIAPGLASRLASGAAMLVLVSSLGACARTNPRRLQDAGETPDGRVDAGTRCGNGVLEPGEACDDGNQLPGDGCSPACTLETCDQQSCPLGCCDITGICRDGTQDSSCGAGGAPCRSCESEARICQDHACQEPGACSPGDTLPCGNCGLRACGSGGLWGICDAQGACSPGQVVVTGACGNCGELSRSCQLDCTYSGLECLAEGECVPGAVEQGASCGSCSVEERQCDLYTCTFGPWNCVSHQECSPGAVETGASCGNCGQETRTCGTDCTFPEWQCAGEGECAPGSTSTQGCTCGQKTCGTGCLWGPCQTFSETCNGIDDNCNGVCDDGFACCRGSTEACTTSCGSQSTRTCSTSCAWGSCQVPAEICNGVDDDCDGIADEGWRAAEQQATYTALSGYQSTCNGTSQRFGLACNQAIHQWCDATGCPVSGFGPIENSGDSAWVTCVSGASVRTVTWATLQQPQYQPGCSQAVAISDSCYSAYHRYCRDLGYGSGFGPITATSVSAQIACVTGVTVRHTDFAIMADKHPGCDGTVQVWGSECNAAIKRYCVDNGHVSGFGPVEHSGSNLDVSCVDP